LQAFGKPVFDPFPHLHRARLAERVFGDEAALNTLEQILHPRVKQLWQQAVDAQNEASWVVEIPLLFEKNLETCFDSVIAVFVDEAEQMRRLLHKGFSRETITARLQRQWTASRKSELADFVMLNQGG